jgi:hypothetical protein
MSDEPLEKEFEEEIDIGEPLLEWEVDEYPRHERSRMWYIIATLCGVALIVYAIATANFLFAVILLMVGVIMLLSTFKEPDRVPMFITTTGVLIDDTYYDYDHVKNFSIIFDPPATKVLYLDFHSRWQPLLAVPLEDMDPNEVRAALLPFCAENFSRMEERLTDIARRMYKL